MTPVKLRRVVFSRNPYSAPTSQRSRPVTGDAGVVHDTLSTHFYPHFEIAPACFRTSHKR
jgi:hypothetical protein